MGIERHIEGFGVDNLDSNGKLNPRLRISEPQGTTEYEFIPQSYLGERGDEAILKLAFVAYRPAQPLEAITEKETTRLTTNVPLGEEVNNILAEYARQLNGDYRQTITRLANFRESFAAGIQYHPLDRRQKIILATNPEKPRMSDLLWNQEVDLGYDDAYAEDEAH